MPARDDLDMTSPPPGSELAVEIVGLRVDRGGRRVIPGLSLSVPRGQLVGLLGPSGSGKTTLLRAIVGVQKLVSGRVEVLGRPAGSKELRHRVGYVTQAPSVYGDLTVLENLRYFARVLGIRGRSLDAEVHRILDAVDLAADANRRVTSLSGGQLSRVSLAAALVGAPELLILDEPTVGLDPVLRRDLWAIFHDLARRNVALVVSSHVMDEATRCDRLVLMRDGGVLADSTLGGLLVATGAADVEEAFLTLVERSGPSAPTGGPERDSP